MKVRVANAEGLIEGNRVSIAGVPAAGSSTSRSPTTGDPATLRHQRLRPAAAQRHQLDIRPKGLAGERFIELVPGQKGAPVADYGMLGSTTANPIEVEDIARRLRRPDPGWAAEHSSPTSAPGWRATATPPTRTSPSSSPSSPRPRGWRASLQSQDDNIGLLLTNLDSVVSSWPACRAAAVIDQFTGNAATVTAAVVSRDAALRDMLRRLGTVLGELNSAFSGHEGQFRDVLDRLPGLETKLQGLLGATDPTLTTIQSDLPTIQQLLIQLADGVWSPTQEGNRLMVSGTGAPQDLSLPAGAPPPPGAASRDQVMRFLTGGR